MIAVFTEGINKDIKGKRAIYQKVKEVIAREAGKKVGAINIIFCSDSYLLDMNQKYLNHDTLTDIITFDYCDDIFVSGDIYISFERVEENARNFNESFDREFHRVIFHGILHLLGYGDKSKDEEKEMRAKEDFYLNLLL
jgi:probable rRNA maturation factor